MGSLMLGASIQGCCEGQDSRWSQCAETSMTYGVAGKLSRQKQTVSTVHASLPSSTLRQRQSSAFPYLPFVLPHLVADVVLKTCLSSLAPDLMSRRDCGGAGFPQTDQSPLRLCIQTYLDLDQSCILSASCAWAMNIDSHRLSHHEHSLLWSERLRLSRPVPRFLGLEASMAGCLHVPALHGI